MLTAGVAAFSCKRVASRQVTNALPPCRNVMPSRWSRCVSQWVLVEADARGEREVGTHADENAAPLPIEQVEVVLIHPPAVILQMPPVVLTDGDENAGGFAGLENDDDVVRVGPTEVRFDESVSTFLSRGLDHGDTPLRGTRCHPALVLGCDVAEHGSGHRVQLTVSVEEPDHPLGLTETVESARS